MSYEPKSSTYQRHPYLKTDFWLLPMNQFWMTPMYSNEAKEYFREFAQRQARNFEYQEKPNLI